MKVKEKTIHGSVDILTMALVLAAVVLTFLNVLDASPLITNQFYFDDDVNILYGVSSSEMPLGILTFHYACWWRPLGFGLPMFVNWVFGFSPLLFHVLGLCIHFATGITLWWFARRLFTVHMAWLSYIFYMLSVNGIAAVGFPVNAFQDGLFTCFLLLGWGLMFPKANKQEAIPKIYLTSAIFLLMAALCKDSWLGAMPVLLITDWILAQKSSLKERFKRLSPFLILLPVPILHFVFVDINIFLNSMYFKIGYGFGNLLRGLLVSFLPFINLEVGQKWRYLLVIFPLVITAASLYSGFNRRRIILLILMFGAILLILLPSFHTVFWIYIRIATLAALSSILFSLALIAVTRLFGNRYLVSLIIIIIVIAFYFSLSEVRDYLISNITR